MPDYLKPVTRTWKLAAILACVLASVVCLLLSLVLWTEMIQKQVFSYEGKPLWIGGVVLSVLGLASGFCGWRLACRRASANGVTLLPTWFIQMFGMLFLIGQLVVVYAMGPAFLSIEGILVCLAMIFIGRRIARTQTGPPR